MASSDVFYGQDTYDLTDLPQIDTQVIGKQLIGLRIARRLQTPYGALALINDDPDFGYDILQLVDGRFNVNDTILAQSQMQAEILKDEEVQDANVSISRKPASQNAYNIDITLTSSAGPFKLTLEISQVTFKILFQEQD